MLRSVRGLADPNRIMILYTLSHSPRNVTELCNELNMPQPLVSRHLKVLRERGMVTTERRGTVIIYSSRRYEDWSRRWICCGQPCAIS